MKQVFIIVLLTAFLCACKNEPKQETQVSKEEDSILYQIAEAHGLENFSDIETLKYTFNVQRNDSLVSSRTWEWHPQRQEATLRTADSVITYNYKTDAAELKEVDQKFINDQYWLLFPFHLVWDELKYEHHEKVKAPLSGKELQQVIVTYPENAGYTPGDVYEIYFEDDYLIQEWVYRSGGSTANPLVTTWEDYETFEGMKMATMHQNPDNTFQLFFTNIEVE